MAENKMAQGVEVLPLRVREPLSDNKLNLMLDKQLAYVEAWGVDLCSETDLNLLSVLIELKERRINEVNKIELDSNTLKTS